MSGHRPPGGFDLSAVYPCRFQRLDAELPESHGTVSDRGDEKIIVLTEARNSNRGRGIEVQVFLV